MTATIIPFRQDVMKLVSDLVVLSPDMTGEQILERHDRLRAALAEAWTQENSNDLPIDQVEEIINHVNAFHVIARRAGASERAIEEFNAKRKDWLSWTAYRTPNQKRKLGRKGA